MFSHDHVLILIDFDIKVIFSYHDLIFLWSQHKVCATENLRNLNNINYYKIYNK